VGTRSITPPPTRPPRSEAHRGCPDDRAALLGSNVRPDRPGNPSDSRPGRDLERDRLGGSVVLRGISLEREVDDLHALAIGVLARGRAPPQRKIIWHRNRAAQRTTALSR
jgi:hypothetical protein